MSWSSRNGIWLALVMLVCGQGCQQTHVRPAFYALDAACADCIEVPEPTPGDTFVVSQTDGSDAVTPASHQAELDAPPSLESASADETPEPLPPIPEPTAIETLGLEQVVQSVYASFPLLQVELAGRDVADGQLVSAWAPYDLNIEMYGIAAPMGYYKNYRSGVALKQARYRGGYVYGGYRNGRDDIQPWYKERLTNEGGEFKVGAGVPLMQGRRIDKYRAEVMASEVARSAVEPQIRAELLQFVLAASDAYWSWVAAGRIYQAQSELLRLATTRAQQIEQRVASGDLERIALIDNQRLIASRETKLIESERKLEAAAIKLSLFLRDERGEPRLVDSEQLPADFPALPGDPDDRLSGDIQQALAARPELQYLDLQVEQIRIELANAQNMLQPRIDARLEASKDIGAPADPKLNNKTPFELEAGIFGELPLQRRLAGGKIQSLQGKLSQLAAKRQYSADKVATEVQDARSALDAAEGRIDRASTTVDLARQSLDLGRQGFESGDLTIVTLNLYEKAVRDAELQLIEAQADYFKAWAAYQAALGDLMSDADGT